MADFVRDGMTERQALDSVLLHLEATPVAGRCSVRCAGGRGRLDAGNAPSAQNGPAAMAAPAHPVLGC